MLNLDRGDFCIGSSLSFDGCRELGPFDKLSGLKPLFIVPDPILMRREGSCKRFLRASVSMFELLEEVECDQRLILRLAIDLASSTSLPLRLFDDNVGTRKSGDWFMPFWKCGGLAGRDLNRDDRGFVFIETEGFFLSVSKDDEKELDLECRLFCTAGVIVALISDEAQVEGADTMSTGMVLVGSKRH